jgi:hypothetical protein
MCWAYEEREAVAVRGPLALRPLGMGT